jgi:hypothetical protein
MKSSPASAKITVLASYITAAILLLVPFHAFLTVWLSGLVGHYTLIRLWKEFLLVGIVLAAAYCLLRDKPLAARLFRSRLTWLILAYMLLFLVAAFVPMAAHKVTSEAMWYGLLVDLRFLVFFLAVLVIAARSDWLARSWSRFLLAPAVLVAAIAVLQFLVLPYDFLRHFGYMASTIFPYETINHNINHLRVMSTLRGANPLGAYLIIPICALLVMFFRQKTQTLNKSLIGGGFLLALIFTFSRSAWLGVLVGVLAVAWLSLRSPKARSLAMWAAAGVLLLGAILALALRHNTTFEDVFLHTNHNSTIATSSDENHASAAEDAARSIVDKPLGSGVGTAGPQSIYNLHGRIAENYYLQIGQEAGVLGMVLFIAICFSVGWMLFVRRDEPLALALFASLLGISLVNLLSHAWTDDTLAYIWWGLAGVSLAPILSGRQKAHGKNHKAK